MKKDNRIITISLQELVRLVKRATHDFEALALASVERDLLWMNHEPIYTETFPLWKPPRNRDLVRIVRLEEIEKRRAELRNKKSTKPQPPGEPKRLPFD